MEIDCFHSTIVFRLWAVKIVKSEEKRSDFRENRPIILFGRVLD